MHLKLIERTGELPVSLQELKANSRIPHDDEDTILELYLEAAVAAVQQASGVVLVPGIYEAVMDDWWHGRLCLSLTPVKDVLSVKYDDVNGIEQEVDAANYHWLAAGNTLSLWLNSSYYAPRTQDNNASAVRVRLHAGYLTESESGYEEGTGVPVQAKRAILMIASHWYNNREAVTQGAAMKVPLAYDYLVAQIKTYA